MIKDIFLPDLGEGIEGAEISEVAVEPGDIITAEDTILVLESDKASMEIPAEVNGKVIETPVTVGEEVKTGQLLIKVEVSDSPETVVEESGIIEQTEADKEKDAKENEGKKIPKRRPKYLDEKIKKEEEEAKRASKG